VPLKRSRKTGNPSVDAESIAYLSTQTGEGSAIAKSLLDRSYLKTMLKTHVAQAIKFCGKDGRVHTDYHLGRAVSGRASCSNPSLHNVPRDRLIRTMYIASPGHVLTEADLKSAELAYLAAESGEETFLRAFEEGLDLHAETAKLVLGLDREPTNEERQSAKAINFGLVYGMTEYGLARRLGITLEEAEQFIEDYFDNGYLTIQNATIHGDVYDFNASLHYAGDVDAALRRACRALRPDGRLVILDTPIALHPRPSGRLGGRHLGPLDPRQSVSQIQGSGAGGDRGPALTLPQHPVDPVHRDRRLAPLDAHLRGRQLRLRAGGGRALLDRRGPAPQQHQRLLVRNRRCPVA